MKKKVKLLQSIAGLGDASPALLEKKYAQMERDMRNQKRKLNGRDVPVWTEEQIRSVIAEEKAKDAAEPRRGFSQDYSFKPGQEVSIDAAVAVKWAEAGICEVIEEKKAA